MSTIIYRLESANEVNQYNSNVNEGPYSVAFDLYTGSRCLPDNDAGLVKHGWMDVDQESYFYGFTSAKQFHAWFNDQSKLVEYADELRIGVYECEDVIKGTHQAVFTPESATLIKTLTVTNF